MLFFVFSKPAVQKRVAFICRECLEKVEQLLLRTPMRKERKEQSKESKREKRAKYLCISNDRQRVTKIYNRFDCTCLVYFLNVPNNFSSIFLKNAQLLHSEEQFCSLSFWTWTHGLENCSFFDLSCITIATQGKQFFYKNNYKFLKYKRTICPKIFDKLSFFATMSQMGVGYFALKIF